MLDRILSFIADLVTPKRTTSSYVAASNATRGTAFWVKKGKTVRVHFHCYGNNIRTGTSIFRSPTDIPKPKALTYGAAIYAVGTTLVSYEIGITTNGEIFQTISSSTTSIMGIIEYET